MLDWIGSPTDLLEVIKSLQGKRINLQGAEGSETGLLIGSDTFHFAPRVLLEESKPSRRCRLCLLE